MSTYSIYRRPLSRNFTRYEPWVHNPFDQNWSSFPPQTHFPSPRGSTEGYGNCECIGGKKVTANCNGKEGFVGICEPYGTRCICTNIATGDAGCGSRKLGYGLHCPG